MSLLKNINITTTTKFWIYTLSKTAYNDYQKFKLPYICFFEDKGIGKDDVVMLYCKSRTENGFFGILQINSALSRNVGNKINIFKDQNLNKYHAKLKYKNLFTNYIGLQEIMKTLCTDIAGYKNAASFKARFIKTENSVAKIEPLGKKLVDKIIQLSVELDKSEESEEENIKSESNENDEENESENSKSENSEEDEKKSEMIEDENGFIPIIVVPCKEFQIPAKGKENYVVNHYKTCNKCDVTNNNNRELCSIIDNAHIEFLVIEDEKHGYFNPALEAYYCVQNYEPMGANELPFIRFMYADNGHELYDKCMLIVWCE